MIEIIIQSFVAAFMAVIHQLQAIGYASLQGLGVVATAAFPTMNFTAYQTTLDNINYFFPLYETVTFAELYGALWLVVTGYRFVKSWLPTVSS